MITAIRQGRPRVIYDVTNGIPAGSALNILRECAALIRAEEVQVKELQKGTP
jgi:hypothetical protein